MIRGKEQEINDGRVKLARMEEAASGYRNVEIYSKDMEAKVALLTQENERLNELIRNKNTDLEELEREKI